MYHCRLEIMQCDLPVVVIDTSMGATSTTVAAAVTGRLAKVSLLV